MKRLLLNHFTVWPLVLSLFCDPVSAAAPSFRPGPLPVYSSHTHTNQALMPAGLWLLHSYSHFAPWLRQIAEQCLTNPENSLPLVLIAGVAGGVRAQSSAVLEKVPSPRRPVPTKWTAERFAEIWGSPPVAVRDRRSSEQWIRAGHGAIVQAAQKKYGTWTKFVFLQEKGLAQDRLGEAPPAREKWTAERFAEIWESPPAAVHNRRSSEEWIRAGHRAVVQAAKRKYGTWTAFVNLQETGLQQDRLKDIWNAPPSGVANKFSAAAWIAAGHGDFVTAMVNAHKSWEKFILVSKDSYIQEWTPEKIDALFADPPPEVSNKWNSSAWEKAGYPHVPILVRLRGKPWLEFTQAKREEEVLLKLWNVPPPGVSDIRNSLQWFSAGYGRVVNLAARRAGSWEEWVRSRDLLPVQRGVRSQWQAKGSDPEAVEAIIGSTPLNSLTDEQHQALGRLKNAGVLEARDALIASQYSAVRRQVRWFLATSGREIRIYEDDFLQAAMVGVVPGEGGVWRAVERYDPTLLTSFGGMVSVYVKHELLESVTKIRRLKSRETAVEDIASYPVPSSPEPDEIENFDALREKLTRALNVISASERDKEIFRRLLANEQPVTIATQYGVAESIVSRLKTSILDQLRSFFRDDSVYLWVGAKKFLLPLILALLPLWHGSPSAHHANRLQSAA